MIERREARVVVHEDGPLRLSTLFLESGDLVIVSRDVSISGRKYRVRLTFDPPIAIPEGLVITTEAETLPDDRPWWRRLLC